MSYSDKIKSDSCFSDYGSFDPNAKLGIDYKSIELYQDDLAFILRYVLSSYVKYCSSEGLFGLMLKDISSKKIGEVNWNLLYLNFWTDKYIFNECFNADMDGVLGADSTISSLMDFFFYFNEIVSELCRVKPFNLKKYETYIYLNDNIYNIFLFLLNNIRFKVSDVDTDFNFDKGSELFGIELLYYDFLSELERILLYFYLRDFSQNIIAKFFGVSQTAVSYRLKILKKKMNLVREVQFPLIRYYKKIKPKLLPKLDEDDVFILEGCLKSMSQSFGVSRGISQGQCRYKINTLIDMLINSESKDFFIFGKLLSKNLVWGSLGRKYYCTNDEICLKVFNS